MARRPASVKLEDVECHFCHEAGNGTSPYRCQAYPDYPIGVRFVVCSPHCSAIPAEIIVFVDHTKEIRK